MHGHGDCHHESHDSSGRAPIQVGLIVAPGCFIADVIGVHFVFDLLDVFPDLPDVQLHLIWKTPEPVNTYPSWRTVPTTTFADCPDLDVLAVGATMPGTIADPEMLAFVRRQAETAKAVIGICADSLVLGGAGLLEGRKATASFPIIDALPGVGAHPVTGGAVVRDGKFLTAGPVTGPFEAALQALSMLYGEDAARRIELTLEYLPRPVFGTGSPERAGPEMTEKVTGIVAPLSSALGAASAAAYQDHVSAVA
ncbi:MAG: DJ-1/PfpI family protein [Paracoccaceae bacterium]|nr:DJ-1/PfpI family protein [Paracoccaceae bacterium]